VPTAEPKFLVAKFKKNIPWQKFSMSASLSNVTDQEFTDESNTKTAEIVRNFIMVFFN
jgi:hypothetical protein